MVKLSILARIKRIAHRFTKFAPPRNALIGLVIITGLIGAVFFVADKPGPESSRAGNDTVAATKTSSKDSPEPPKQSTQAPAQPTGQQPALAAQPPTPKSAPKKTTGPPAPTPFVVSALGLTGSSVCSYDPDLMGPYTHAVSHVVSVSIAPSYPGGTITWKWEYAGDYADMDGLDSSVFTQQIQAGTRQTTLSTFGDARSVDAEGLSNNFKFRAVILSPNSMTSSWISTTGC